MVSINVFISHSWAYSDHYETLAAWLFKSNWTVSKGQIPLNFVDWSVPKDDPIHDAPNEVALGMAINSLIVNSHVVVIPTGMYANFSDWIGKEISGARSNRKPILGVNLWGSQRTSSIVQQNAAEVVGWQKQSVAGAIWRLAQV
ncbi:MAG: nuclease [Gammaproteobacteria bacterium]|nr:MAG: nuclease [Gammaproteobacteria bacterium]